MSELHSHTGNDDSIGVTGSPGAGPNEIDIVKTADTVAVLVPPSSGDNIRILKASLLEITDVFVVNKADLPRGDRTMQEFKKTFHMQNGEAIAGHHRPEALSDIGAYASDNCENRIPPAVEAVAKDRDGVMEVLETLEEHREWLTETGELTAQARQRYAAEVRTLLREDTLNS